MVFREIECLTNNALLKTLSLGVTFVEGASVLVLTLARDRIHTGWSILTHPLYGNIQPSQQPFRSILVGLPDEYVPSDPDAIMVLERAVELFSRASSVSCRMDPKAMADYASLDVYLIRDSMEKYGLWKTVPQEIEL